MSSGAEITKLSLQHCKQASILWEALSGEYFNPSFLTDLDLLIFDVYSLVVNFGLTPAPTENFPNLQALSIKHHTVARIFRLNCPKSEELCVLPDRFPNLSRLRLEVNCWTLDSRYSEGLDQDTVPRITNLVQSGRVRPNIQITMGGPDSVHNLYTKPDGEARNEGGGPSTSEILFRFLSQFGSLIDRVYLNSIEDQLLGITISVH